MIHPEIIREAIEVLRLQGDTAMADQVAELSDAFDAKPTADQVRGAARWALGQYDESKADEMSLEGAAYDVLGIGLHDELMHAARAHGRVMKLAEFLLTEFNEESQRGDAVDVAIRLLRDHKQQRERLTDLNTIEGAVAREYDHDES